MVIYKYDTSVDIAIQIELIGTGICPTELLSIVVVKRGDDEVLYDGQVMPLYRDKRYDILNLRALSLDGIGDPIPSIIVIQVE